MIADRHRLIAKSIEEQGLFGALVLVVEERALELVAGIDRMVLAPFSPLAHAVDLGGAASDAADAFAGRILFGVAGGGRAVILLDVGMRVVGVQDRQRKAAVILRQNRNSARKERRQQHYDQRKAGHTADRREFTIGHFANSFRSLTRNVLKAG